MASEPVVSDHSSACEKGKPEDRIMEPEKVLPPKENVENSKSEESAGHPVVPSADIEVKTEPETAGITQPIVGNVECKSETENAAKKDLEKPEVEPPKRIEVPESSPVKAEGKLEELPVKDVEVIVPIDANVLVEESKDESAPLAEEKSLEQSAKEIPVVELVKDVDVESTKDKIEDSNPPTEVKPAIEETVAIAKSHDPEVKGQEKDVECYPSDGASEKISERTEEKEPAKGSAQNVVEPERVEENEVPDSKTVGKSVVSREVEGQSEDKVVEPGKIDTEKEIPEVETEEKCVPDELVKSTGKSAEILEKAPEEEASKGPEKTETEGKIDERNDVEKEKQVDEAAKPDTQNPKSAEDCKELVASKDTPKEYTPVKVQKLSNSFIKKMKSSLVKARKAITGKSQNSKSTAAPPTSKG